jgi:hypothetical protein
VEYQVLKPADAGYPARLKERLGADAPTLYHSGPLELLGRFTLAVAASDSIPAQAMFAANQLLFTIREFGLNYIGGWHSVMETEIFRIALDRRNDPQGMRSLTLVSARGLARESWEGFLADRFGAKGPFTGFPEKEEYFRRAMHRELLVLSITEPDQVRMTDRNIVGRNLAACALANTVFIPFAEKGTKTYRLCKRALTAGIPMFAPECDESRDLVALGIPVLNRRSVGPYLERLGAKRGGPGAFACEPAAEPTAMPSPPEPRPRASRRNSGQYQLFEKDQ